ncbi:2298_t:CDS:2, partial [Scutellospora calospora]
MTSSVVGKGIFTETVRKALNYININLSEVTVGNINRFEKIVEGYPQNTVGIIVTSQTGCSISSSKRAKSQKSSASIIFTSINEMATDIPAYFLLRKDHKCKDHDLIE